MNLTKYQALSEIQLNKVLPAETNDLARAMRYSCLDAGKRLRPALVYATGEMLGVEQDMLHAAAASVELIHCYTLIHDDLPAMDDDAMRRGKPSCHKAFGESTAILAGDALQSLAFQMLSDPKYNPISAEQRIKQVHTMAQAIGGQGLVLGQLEDIAAENKKVSVHELEQIHQNKTGALFVACVVLAHQASEKHKESSIGIHLKNYAKNLGLLFQIQDDILDVTSNSTTLGKSAGIDTKNAKSTYASILGLEVAKLQAQAILNATLDTLESFGDKAQELISIAHFSLERAC